MHQPERTMPTRLDPDTLTRRLDPHPASTREIILALRDLILDTAPGVTEAIKFHSLCYFLGDAPYRSIGGNVCAIGIRDGEVTLWFIQGADLPDPHHLLTGKAKAKREVPISGVRMLRDPAIRALIVASHGAAQRIARGHSR